MTFAQRLKVIRVWRGLTQVELAEKCGIPANYISNMETGKVVPVGDWEKALKGALGWTDEPAIDDLVQSVDLEVSA